MSTCSSCSRKALLQSAVPLTADSRSSSVAAVPSAPGHLRQPADHPGWTGAAAASGVAGCQQQLSTGKHRAATSHAGLDLLQACGWQHLTSGLGYMLRDIRGGLMRRPALSLCAASQRCAQSPAAGISTTWLIKWCRSAVALQAAVCTEVASAQRGQASRAEAHVQLPYLLHTCASQTCFCCGGRRCMQRPAGVWCAPA